jgi:hypothetical protein
MPQPRTMGGEGAIPAFALFPVNRRRHPIGGAASQPVAGCLAVMIGGIGLLREGGPVVQAIGVDDGAGVRSGRADIIAAALADQEIGGARAKAVELDQGPVCGADVDRPVGIAGRARVARAAERTAAGAQLRVRGRLREAGPLAMVTITSTLCFHSPETAQAWRGAQSS